MYALANRFQRVEIRTKPLQRRRNALEFRGFRSTTTFTILIGIFADLSVSCSAVSIETQSEYKQMGHKPLNWRFFQLSDGIVEDMMTLQIVLEILEAIHQQ